MRTFRITIAESRTATMVRKSHSPEGLTGPPIATLNWIQFVRYISSQTPPYTTAAPISRELALA